LYVYCIGNPIRYIDPNGKDADVLLPVFEGIAVGIAGANFWNPIGWVAGVFIVGSIVHAEVQYAKSHPTPPIPRDSKGNPIPAEPSQGELDDNRTAGEIISKDKKGSINREFPKEWRDKTLGEIERAAKQGNKSAQKAKKLLGDKDFDKSSNSGRANK
jgi:hypothetical protein